jgi:ubiquinone biosynthesis protein
VLRPGVERAIARDLALLETAAALVERWWSDGRRLKPREVVAEFARHLDDELDLLREAANASQLGAISPARRCCWCPVYWDFVRAARDGDGAHARHADLAGRPSCASAGVDIPALARRRGDLLHAGVPRRLFPRRHAPGQHPGRHRAEKPRRYVALDFGIMGTLTERRQELPRAELPRVLQPRLQARGAGAPRRRLGARRHARRRVRGRDPRGVRADLRPAAEGDLFGKLLLRLFQTSRRFNVEVQPQLVLLQKTLLNIEGLGRELDPDLDLWQTAKPYLERWMREQVGWRACCAICGARRRSGPRPCRRSRASCTARLRRSAPAAAGRAPAPGRPARRGATGCCRRSSRWWRSSWGFSRTGSDAMISRAC